MFRKMTLVWRGPKSSQSSSRGTHLRSGTSSCQVSPGQGTGRTSGIKAGAGLGESRENPHLVGPDQKAGSALPSQDPPLHSHALPARLSRPLPTCLIPPPPHVPICRHLPGLCGFPSRLKCHLPGEGALLTTLSKQQLSTTTTLCPVSPRGSATFVSARCPAVSKLA